MAFFPAHDFPGFANPDHLMTASGFGGGGVSRHVYENFRCYPVSMFQGLDKSAANYGGKIFLPGSYLDKLTKLKITYPMLFKLTDALETKIAHAGVQEFIAEEGRAYLPQWLMTSLNLKPNDIIKIKSTDLELGTFIKLQPQTVDFLQITNPRAVLETAFRNFSCLTVGDIFVFSYNNKEYGMEVLKIFPNNEHNAICTMETDLEVDFAAPVGYVEPQSANIGGATGYISGPRAQGTMAQKINYTEIAPIGKSEEGSSVDRFAGGGSRLGTKRPGKATMTSSSLASSSTTLPSASSSGPSMMAASTHTGAEGDPRYRPLRLPPNQLFFGYAIVPVKKQEEDNTTPGEDDSKDQFRGTGQKIRRN